LLTAGHCNYVSQHRNDSNINVLSISCLCFVTDYNECRYGTHKCEGPCINTAGSYACDCTAGYRLNTGDRRSCDGLCLN